MATLSGGAPTLVRITPLPGVLRTLAVDNELRVSFPTPALTPNPGPGRQRVRIVARPHNAVGGDVLLTVEVWESGAYRTTPISGHVLTAAGGTADLSALWNASVLADPTGAGVELRLSGTGSTDNSLEIGSVAWDYEAMPTAATTGGALAPALAGGASAVRAGIPTAVRVTFPPPPAFPTAGLDNLGNGRQEVRIRVRKNDPGGTGPDPTCRVDLYETGDPDGAPRATPIPETGVSLTTGALLVGYFDAAFLSDHTGASVELRISGTGTAPLEMGAVEWNAYSSEQAPFAGGARAVGRSGGATITQPPFPVTAGGARARVAAGGAKARDARYRVYQESGDVVFANVSWATEVDGDLELDLTASLGQAYVSGADIEAYLDPYATAGGAVAHAYAGGASSEAASGDIAIALTGLSTEETTGALTPIPGAVALSLTGVATEETAGVLTAVPGVATAPLTGVVTGETTGALVPVPGMATLLLTGVTSEEAAGVLTPVPGTATVALTGLTTEETTGALAPTPGTATLALTGVATEETAGALTPTPGATTRALTGLTTEETTGGLTVVGQGTIGLAGVTSEETTGALTAVAGAPPSVALTGIATEETAGALSPVPGAATQALAGATTEETTGALTPTPGATIGALNGAATEETAGTLTPAPATVTKVLTGVPTEETTGTLTISNLTQVALTGIATEETAGVLTAVPGASTLVLAGVPTEELTGVLAAVPATIAVALSGPASDDSVGTLVARPGGILPPTDKLVVSRMLRIPRDPRTTTAGPRRSDRTLIVR